jgi:hydrogenase maturation factor
MNLVVGRLVAIRDEGCTGTLSLRGACIEVALDLVPGVAVGDSVLVEAGVALSRLDAAEEDDPCV